MGIGGNRERPHEKLLVWQNADVLVRLVYQEAKRFPPQERFGLTSQLLRAVLSIPLNIIEGNARGSRKDYLRFLFIARGSLAETMYLLLLAKDFCYLQEARYDEVKARGDSTSYLLQRLIKSLSEKPQSP